MPDIAQQDVDALGAFRHIAGEYGGTPASITKKIRELEEDNRSQREELRGLKEKMPEGSVVVTKEDAKLLAAFKELGEPKEIKAKLEAGDASAAKLTSLERRTEASAFAVASGLDASAVDILIALPALAGAKFEVRKQKVDKVEKDVGYLTLPGDGQTPMSFADAQEKVAELKGLRTATATTDKSVEGVAFVIQGGGQGGATGTIYDTIRKESAPAAAVAAAAPAAAAVPSTLAGRMGIQTI